MMVTRALSPAVRLCILVVLSLPEPLFWLGRVAVRWVAGGLR
jgi:hypothetical protein